MGMNTVGLEVPVSAPALTLTDSEIIERVRAGDWAVFEVLMRRHNQQIYRAARAVVRDEQEVEDVMQQTYVNAFTHLDQFEERSRFSTWLTRIALNEAYRRRRQIRRRVAMAEDSPNLDGDRGALVGTVASPHPDPEQQAYVQELHRALEDAVDGLPETYRIVFMLREIEGLSTRETGLGLGLGEEAVKTRLHRARAMIRRAMTAQIGGPLAAAFPFHASRCDRVVSAVLARIGARPR
jgi:RNA polymerase sigma-70 factor (ECF subfamily)